MNKIRLLIRNLSFTIFFITIYSIAPYSKFPILNTTIWWGVIATILYFFWESKKYIFDSANTYNMRHIKWFLIYMSFAIVRAVFLCDNYWDWKGMIGVSMGLLMPIVAYSATDARCLQSILAFYVKYTLPIFIIIITIISTDTYGFYLVPIYFFTIFYPVLTGRWKFIIIALSIFVVMVDVGARSNVIKFGASILILFVFYFRLFIPISLIELLRKVFMIVPVILFFLAVTGVFNIFKMDEYLKGDMVQSAVSSVGEDAYGVDIDADTRTDIYVEVLQSAQNHNSWIIGRSPARGNDSQLYFDPEISKVTGRKERLENEVAILNIFTWTGLIGVFLYFLVFYYSSYLAVNYSNNIFCKMIGILISFRWAYAWVEDVNQFDLTYFILWSMIGLCISKSFRSMSDKEMKHWIRGVFDSKIRKNDFEMQFGNLELSMPK